MRPKHLPMTLGNMRRLGVPGLMVYCLNPKCLHRERLDVDGYGISTSTAVRPPQGLRELRHNRCRRSTKLGRAAADRKPYRNQWRAGRGSVLVPLQQLQLVDDKLPRCVQHTGFIVLGARPSACAFRKSKISCMVKNSSTVLTMCALLVAHPCAPSPIILICICRLRSAACSAQRSPIHMAAVPSTSANNHDQHQRNALPVNRGTVLLVLLVSHRRALMELRATVSC